MMKLLVVAVCVASVAATISITPTPAKEAPAKPCCLPDHFQYQQNIFGFNSGLIQLNFQADYAAGTYYKMTFPEYHYINEILYRSDFKTEFIAYGSGDCDIRKAAKVRDRCLPKDAQLKAEPMIAETVKVQAWHWSKLDSHKKNITGWDVVGEKCSPIEHSINDDSDERSFSSFFYNFAEGKHDTKIYEIPDACKYSSNEEGSTLSVAGGNIRIVDELPADVEAIMRQVHTGW